MYVGGSNILTNWRYRVHWEKQKPLRQMRADHLTFLFGEEVFHIGGGVLGTTFRYIIPLIRENFVMICCVAGYRSENQSTI